MLTLDNSVLRSDRWLAVVMLLSLHLALLLGTHSQWTRPLLLAHLGMFLLWQPLWRGESKLRPGSAMFIVSSSLVALLWLNWWVLAFWVSGLFSLVGGRVFAFHTRWQRWRYLLAMVYLLAVLLLWVTPHLFGLPVIVDMTGSMMDVLLPLLLFAITLLPDERERADAAQIVDFIYSLLLFMLLTLLVLGSLAFMTLAHVDYFEALMRTLFLIALLLFVLGWLWSPRLGFSGLQPMFSRYLLNMGTPFELWTKNLAETFQQESSPTIFIEKGIEHLAQLPWLSGLSWVSGDGHGNLGVSSEHRIEVSDHDLHLTLFSRQRISPSAILHVHLLARLLGHFYQAKRREQRLREMIRLQAVYETGARLTHDLKNMLQSLLSLTSMAQLQPDKTQPILQHQLPLLIRRIEFLLGKLKSSSLEQDTAQLPLDVWWEGVRQRRQHEQLEWVEKNAHSVLQNASIPVTLFDCVADNLIDNALNKRLREPGIRIVAMLCVSPFSFSVCDSGSAIPAGEAKLILNTVVMSEDGLGVGLYQAARWAEESGFKLKLVDNVSGNVRFELTEASSTGNLQTDIIPP